MVVELGIYREVVVVWSAEPRMVTVHVVLLPPRSQYVTVCPVARLLPPVCLVYRSRGAVPYPAGVQAPCGEACCVTACMRHPDNINKPTNNHPPVQTECDVYFIQCTAHTQVLIKVIACWILDVCTHTSYVCVHLLRLNRYIFISDLLIFCT